MSAKGYEVNCQWEKITYRLVCLWMKAVICDGYASSLTRATVEGDTVFSPLVERRTPGGAFRLASGSEANSALETNFNLIKYHFIY
jgi:hypothetical protein